MPTHSFTPTEKTRLRRNPRRAVYDRELIYEVLDEAMLCHLGLSIDGTPCVLPTIHTRIGDELFLHGSTKNRMFKHIADGAEACLSVTILDGLVLARSGLHHSMNYRSVVIFAKGRIVEGVEEKQAALKALVEQIVPERWEDARPPSPNELKATTVMAFPIEEASAKVRSGPPIDDPEDEKLPVWAGVVPVKLCSQPPVTDHAGLDVPLPDYLANYNLLPRVTLPA